MENKSPEEIANCAYMACVMEASAEKPGNVTPKHSFGNMTYQDFVASARNLEEYIERAATEGGGL